MSKDHATADSRLAPVRTALRLVRRGVRDPDARGEFSRAFLRRLRGHPRVRRFMQRASGPSSGLAGARIRIPSGDVLPEHASAALPVTLVVLLGLSDDDVEGWIERVARSQMMTVAFKPLFVVDRDDFTTLRRYGYPFEFIIPYDDWLLVGDPSAWAGHVRTRLTGLKQVYRPATVVAPSGSPPEGEACQAAFDALLSWQADPSGPATG